MAAVTGPAGVDRQPGPVVIPVALGALAGGVALPRPAGQADGELAGLARARGGGHPVAGGHRQHVTDPAAFQVSAQARVGAIHLIAGDPGGRGPRGRTWSAAPLTPGTFGCGWGSLTYSAAPDGTVLAASGVRGDDLVDGGKRRHGRADGSGGQMPEQL